VTETESIFTKLKHVRQILYTGPKHICIEISKENVVYIGKRMHVVPRKTFILGDGQSWSLIRRLYWARERRGPS
jgi:hypothetical protein